MNYKLNLAAIALLFSFDCVASGFKLSNDASSGNFSLGTRNTISMFNDDQATGTGIGGQCRLQFSDKLNSEWYYDWITSKRGHYTARNDHHIGWSLMFYPGRQPGFDKLIKPYIIAGHCFDYCRVSEQKDASNFAERFSMATQAGLGTHLNITKRFDCSLSVQYMMHFGKELETEINDEVVTFEKKKFSSPDGHLLFTLSFNYKFVNLFKGWNVGV